VYCCRDLAVIDDADKLEGLVVQLLSRRPQLQQQMGVPDYAEVVERQMDADAAAAL
jgi:hypothetical protein